MKTQAFLTQPFDYFNTTKTKWLYITIAIVFAQLFLIIFQPYGLSEEIQSPDNPLLHKFLFFFSIAFSTFFALSLSQFVLREQFGFQNVNTNKYMIWLLIEALILLLINFGMSFIIPDLGNDFEKELNLWFQVAMYPKLLMILIFPFFGSVIYIAIKRLRTEVKVLDQQLLSFKYKYDKTKQANMLHIKDEKDQLEVSIALKDVLYIESSNQYVLVHFIENKTIKKHIVRNRLKHILTQTETLPIKQCHRSYAVNLIHVKHLVRKKGRDALILSTDFQTIDIPVSNSFLKFIKQELNQ